MSEKTLREVRNAVGVTRRAVQGYERAGLVAATCRIALEKELIMTLVRIREEKGLTQAQMAELCGVSQPTIARLERATHSPQLDSLFKILVPLGYTLQIVALKTNH